MAIENARLYEDVARRESWAAATAQITAILSDAVAEDDAVHRLAEQALATAHADAAWVVRLAAGGPVLTETACGHEVDGERFDGDLARLIAACVDTGEAQRLPEVDLEGWGRGAILILPLGGPREPARALILGWVAARTERFHVLDIAQPAAFAEQAGVAVQLGRAREDRQRLAVFEDRDRIGRDLHDLVIQRLFAVGLGLQGAARIAVREAPDLAARLERAVDDLDETIRDIRHTIFALGTAEASEDVQAEVTSIVDRAASTLKFRPRLRFDGPVRSLVSPELAPDLLAVLGEALSNASRHASASSIEVTLSAGDRIDLVVADDGRGLPDDVVESGLRNMRERAERRGGSLVIDTAPDAGTRLRWSVPTQDAADQANARGPGDAGGSGGR
ncbi:sensor histidine kinase [Nocardioides sp. GXZ039]|uniref:sensor histidine kinase n=1 Tax=Nocardioides sp. GXZ039 TaxID=3136018 RepID=UPI0030F48D80